MNLTELKNKAFENKEVKKEYDELSYEFELYTVALCQYQL